MRRTIPPRTTAEAQPESEPPLATARWASQLKATARSFLAYVQIRTQLFALECREAATVGGRQLLVSLTAAFLFLLGYALVIVCLIERISFWLQLPWVWPTLVLGMVHLLAGSAVWWFAQTRLKRPLFEATLAELEKDQEWITRNLPSRPERRN